jgi:tetratricopeptide (TPR) repeat protein
MKMNGLCLCAVAVAAIAGDAGAHGSLHDQIDAVTRSMERDGHTSILMLRRSELYRRHRDWSAAHADHHNAARLDPGNLEIDLARARLAVDRNLLGDAVVALNRYLAARPQSEVALALRADVHDRAGRPADAATDYAAALRLAAEPSVELVLGLANALARAGDVAGALAAADTGILRLGPLVTLQQWSIEHLVANHRFDEALIRLDAMLAGSSRKEAGLTRRAEILAAAGRPLDAHSAFAAARSAWQMLPDGLRSTPAMGQLRYRIDSGLAMLSAAR